jgi:hypothetical protein
MTMTLADNLDVDTRLQWCVCSLRLVARVARCVLAMVVFHDGRRGYLYRFLAVFPIINWPYLFSLINKNSKSFASFQKKELTVPGTRHSDVVDGAGEEGCPPPPELGTGRKCSSRLPDLGHK